MGNVINHIKLCKLHKEIGHVDSSGASQSTQLTKCGHACAICSVVRDTQ